MSTAAHPARKLADTFSVDVIAAIRRLYPDALETEQRDFAV
jgi:hypothetical protein